MHHIFGSSGFFIGVGGGATVPTGNFNNAYKTGWNITVPLGWQSFTTPWGLRLDGTYNQVGGRSFTAGGLSSNLADAKLWSGMLDATFRLPWGVNKTSGFYLLGGVGLHHLTNFGNGTFSSSDVGSVSSNGASTTKFGWNAGGGLDFGIGPVAAFVESRFVSVLTSGQHTNYVPVIAGIKLF
jgi:opacity protein-like surface antigen